MFKKNKKKKEDEFKKVEVPGEILEKVEDEIISIEDPEKIEAEVEEVKVPEIEPNQETEEVVKEEVVEEEDDEVKKAEENLKNLKLKKEQEKTLASARLMVVKQLPEAPIRNYQDKDGSAVSLITAEEALEEILRILKSK